MIFLRNSFVLTCFNVFIKLTSYKKKTIYNIIYLALLLMYE